MNERLKIDALRTALVVIDLQKGIVGRETRPYPALTVVANAARLAAACRAKGLPVFLVHVTASPDGRDRLAPVADVTWAGGGSMPSDWSEIVPELGPEANDFVIPKKQWGAFYGTELDLQLRRRGIATIILCGISTDIGVESTARFAYEYGYAQIFAEDACAAMSAEEHAHSVRHIFPRLGQVRPTAIVLEALGAA